MTYVPVGCNRVLRLAYFFMLPGFSTAALALSWLLKVVMACMCVRYKYVAYINMKFVWSFENK